MCRDLCGIDGYLVRPGWYFFSLRQQHAVSPDTYTYRPTAAQVHRYAYRPGRLSNHPGLPIASGRGEVQPKAMQSLQLHAQDVDA